MTTIKFVVDPVENAAKPEERVDSTYVSDKLKSLKKKIEAYQFSADLIELTNGHGFIQACGRAYDNHLPLCFGPQHIWLMIMQGVAKHVELNTERLRGTLVDHEGQMTLEVRRDDFVLGETNPWPEVFPQFAELINTSSKHEITAAAQKPFSCSTSIDVTASSITLMDMMQGYFRYLLSTKCGFPSIELEGTVEDWQDLQARIQLLRTVDDTENWNKWLDEVDRYVQVMVQSAQGEADLEIWKNFFKQEDSSGGPFITGWINLFVPYLRSYNKGWDWNPMVIGGVESKWDNTYNSLHQGISTSPMTWDYLGTIYPMRLMAGFFGIEQTQSLAVRPSIGWVIVHDK